ncbi:MAG: pyruvate kinase [Acidobacteriota bacterium]
MAADAALPGHKTRIVATIGPASASRAVMAALVTAGMDVARLNFSHGDFASHARVIADLRAAASACGRRLAIMVDLPGPKLRIGTIAHEPVELRAGGAFTLTTRATVGDANGASVSLATLPTAVRPGAAVFLNDGLIELEVEHVEAQEIRCRVVAGGELRSGKGLNLPGVDLGIAAFTEHDRACLAFALEQGVDILGQSFVGCAADIEAVRAAAAALGHHPFVVAKIERANALDHLDEILAAADGVMVARGDLGVEVPIERMAVLQKELIRRANARGRPVITATQMLESMVTQRRPTRAEATDVANAVLDGTDALMLSEESAMGAFPVEAVRMLARIAAAVEPHRVELGASGVLPDLDRTGPTSNVDLVALAVARTCGRALPVAVFTPTVSGASARSVARFRLPVWVIAVSPHEATCRALQLSYGVIGVHRPGDPGDWNAFARSWLAEHGIAGDIALLTGGPSEHNPDANTRMEIIDLAR